ncbi:hypothetical protein [Streptomyces sp. CAU 1734]|uniref:hypothetical protein n=1 Tax=Streptomyces sp. CAU 1734 TaxID=3140360 RepID=UPI003260C8B6
MHPPDTTRPPTLLDALLDKYKWTPYRVFRSQFKDAGQKAARELKNPRLRGLELTETTYRRWRQGKQEPTGDFASVLEFLFGVDVTTLLQPAPVNVEYTALRAPHPQTLSAAYQLDHRMPTSSLFLAAPPGGGGVWHLNGGDGGVFDGTQVAAAAYEARPAAGGVVVIGEEDLEHVRVFTRPARRALVFASLGGRGRDAFYLMDSTAAREATALPFVRDLKVPDAYRLDHLTYALMWAALCFDDWLQADDVMLAGERERLERGAVVRTGFARSALPGLSSAGAVWLGSHVCAVHAERHLAGSGVVPVLWSQCRSGPEAAAWLLLKDRMRVLDLLRPPGGSGPGQVAVCLPEKAVKGSEPYERVLLLLFAALLESRGIAIAVSDDPAYTAMEEVLVVAERTAVVGNWMPRGDGICAAATAEDPARVGLYAGAVAHARAHSVIAANDSTGRLRRLAEYLELDGAWLAGRCRELTATGIGGLVRTRSHLLHTGGLEASLARLGDLEP